MRDCHKFMCSGFCDYRQHYGRFAEAHADVSQLRPGGRTPLYSNEDISSSSWAFDLQSVFR